MDIVEIISFLAALLVTVTVHEASHALTAYYLGDPTAKLEGRISLNPVRHLDPVGSLVFLLTWRIGWGKPVPVDPRNFQNPVRDNALTALAGPVSNFVLAFLIALPLKYLGEYMPGWMLGFLSMLFDLNVVLGIFNFFPFPPLDGSKIIGLIVPSRWHRGYERFLAEGMKYFVVIILIDAIILRDLIGFSFLGYAIGFLYHYVSTALLLGT